MNISKADMPAIVRSEMTEKRYAHTMGVVKECVYLGAAFGLSAQEQADLETAALLHDIAKYVPAEEQKKLCARYHIDTADTTDATIHELGGAALARDLFGTETVNDMVFNAILSHATGRADMTLTDMLLCLADYTEEGRTFSSCRAMREYLHTQCDTLTKQGKKVPAAVAKEAMRRYFEETVSHLTETKQTIDPRIFAAKETL